MKKYGLFVLLLAVLCMASCERDAAGTGDEMTDSEPVALSVRMDRQGDSRTRAAISRFSYGDAMGLFLTHADGNLDYPYTEFGMWQNIRSVFRTDYWQQEPTVFLGNTLAKVFAYYPFNDSPDNWKLNGKNIPVEHVSQTDYLYGTHMEGQEFVHKYAPVAYLTMKHALSLVQFHIDQMGGVHNFLLNRIEIVREAGNEFSGKGTLDISTGAITPSPNNTDPVVWENNGSWPVTYNTWDEQNLIRLLVMPMPPLQQEGNVAVRLQIDWEWLTFPLPAGTQWKSGTEYTFIVNLQARTLNLGKVTIEEWKVEN